MAIVKDFAEESRSLRRRRVAEQHEAFEPRHGDIVAVLRELDGSTQHPTQPSKSWVSILNQPESLIPVYNSTSVNKAGTPVWVGPQLRPPHSLEIKGIYHGGASQGIDTQAEMLGIPDHGQIHQFPSEDNAGASVVLIYQPAIQPLKTTGNGSDLTITTQGFIYINAGGKRKEASGKQTDLTTSVPGSGLVRNVLVYFDSNLEQFDTIEGATVGSGGASPVPEPAVPAGGIPSAYVQLTAGQTSVVTASHVIDARPLFHVQAADSATYNAPFKWVWATEADRVAEDDVTSNDVSTSVLGLQEVDKTLWRATGATPVVLEQIGTSDLLVYRNVPNHVASTWYSLFTNGSDGQIVIPADTVWEVDVQVVGLSPGASNFWGYKISALVVNDGGTTTAYGSTTTPTYESDSNYDVRVTADDANDALEVQVQRTGGVNWDVNWKAAIRRVSETST
jgi:hypothetical protein